VAKNHQQSVPASNSSFGVASFVTGFISIFLLSPIFVPISAVLGLVGLIRGQALWSVLGLICAVIGFVTSPILMGLVFMGAAVAQ